MFVIPVVRSFSLSKTGLAYHRSHKSKLSKVYFTKVHQPQPTGNSSQFCHKIYDSEAGLRSPMAVYKANNNEKNKNKTNS